MFECFHWQSKPEEEIFVSRCILIKKFLIKPTFVLKKKLLLTNIMKLIYLF